MENPYSDLIFYICNKRKFDFSFPVTRLWYHVRFPVLARITEKNTVTDNKENRIYFIEKATSWKLQSKLHDLYVSSSSFYRKLKTKTNPCICCIQRYAGRRKQLTNNILSCMYDESSSESAVIKFSSACMLELESYSTAWSWNDSFILLAVVLFNRWRLKLIWSLNVRWSYSTAADWSWNYTPTPPP